jgi:hypothetical protein
MILKIKAKKCNVEKSQENFKRRRFGIVGGSVVEYALILGFSIFIFIIVVGIILNIINWSDSNLQSFLSNI